jgi:hypothetical protein
MSALLLAAGDEEQRDVVNRLLLSTWHSMRVDSTAYWFKCAFDDAHYWLLVTDLASVWYRRADAVALQQDLEACNGKLSMETHKLLTRLQTHLTGASPPVASGAGAAAAAASGAGNAVEWQFTRQGAVQATLQLDTKIGQFNFKWRFVMKALSGGAEARDLLREQLLLPLFDMAHAYERRIAQLSALLHRREAFIQEKLPRAQLPTELRKVTDDEQLERDILDRFPPSGLPVTAFKSDSFGERAFTQRLKAARDALQQQRAQEREAKRARTSQPPQSASVPSEGSPASLLASAAVATPAVVASAPPRKAPTSSERAHATSAVARAPDASSAAAVARPPARADSIEETAEELERRRELEERLERERKQAQIVKAAQQKKRGLL